MPDLNNLTNYDDVIYRYCTVEFPTSETMLLALKYDKEFYQNEKEKINNGYNFLDQVVKFKDTYYMPEYEFYKESFLIKVVDLSEKDNYPKSFGMIGVSDEKNIIIYMYFYSNSLDYISNDKDKTTMSEFLDEYFVYDWK
jgi:hypothetical protein